jgi:hypothetical protein
MGAMALDQPQTPPSPTQLVLTEVELQPMGGFIETKTENLYLTTDQRD